MLDKVALDSNILAAMFFKEDASQRALDAVTKPDLITLDLAVIEVGNVAWKQVTLFGKDRDLTLNALQKCQTFISEACDVVRAQDMMAKAYDISIVTTASFYDSLFLALAEKERVPLLTLDKKLYSETAAAHPDASIGASKAPPHECGTRLSRSKPRLNTYALYPRCKHRGIAIKIKLILHLMCN